MVHPLLLILPPRPLDIIPIRNIGQTRGLSTSGMPSSQGDPAANEGANNPVSIDPEDGRWYVKVDAVYVTAGSDRKRVKRCVLGAGGGGEGEGAPREMEFMILIITNNTKPDFNIY